MPLPPKVSEFIEKHGGRDHFGDPSNECVGSRYHSPTPMFTHEVPLGFGIKTVWLCGTCADNLALLRELVEIVMPEPLPWEVRREFGNLIRALAYAEGGGDDG